MKTKSILAAAAALLVLGIPSLPALDSAQNRERGLLVVRVLPDSPAAAAGLLRGDILRTVDGTPVDGVGVLRDLIAGKKSGATVVLSLWRGETELSRNVVLEDRPYRPALGLVLLPGAEADRPLPGGDGSAERVFPGSPPFPMFSSAARIDGIASGSPAEKAGIRVGDLVVAVDGKALGFPPDLASAISARKPGETVTLSVIGADGSKKEMAVELDESPDAKGSARLGVRYSMGYSPRPEADDRTDRPRRRLFRERSLPFRSPSSSSL